MDSPLSLDDLFKLETLRFARFETFFLRRFPGCFLHLDADYRLIIHTSQASAAEVLIDGLEQLKALAWVVLGTEQLLIYLGQELAGSAEFQGKRLDPGAIDLVLESTITVDSEAVMAATATLDRAEQGTYQVQQVQPSTLPGCSLADIATDVEQPVEAVRAWAQEHNITIIPYKEEEIIAGESAIAAYDYFEPIMLQQRKAKRLGLTPPIRHNGHAGGVPAESESQAADPQQLCFKGTYKPARNNYTTTAGRYLSAIDPDDQAAQLEIAREIINQTELGQQHFEKALGGYSKPERERAAIKLRQGFENWVSQHSEGSLQTEIMSDAATD